MKTTLAGAIAIAVAMGGCAKRDREPPPSAIAAATRDVAASAPSAGEKRERPAAGSMREIHATIDVELAADRDARAAIDALSSEAIARGGFVAQSSFARDAGVSRVVLRVPASALLDVRRAAAGAGSITRDEETATDVTDAIADLDARLRSARTEEARLLALTEQRTGTIADVLAADRALADVRERIERLDAESHAAHERVDLATVEVALVAPAAIAREPSFGAKLASAAKDGATAAGELATGLATTALRAGPSASILGAIAFALFALARRWRRGRMLASGA